MRHLTLLLAATAAAYAQGPADLNRVMAGSAPPSFDLPSLEGGRVTLDSLKGKNTVLVFYRGYW